MDTTKKVQPTQHQNTLPISNQPQNKLPINTFCELRSAMNYLPTLSKALVLAVLASCASNVFALDCSKYKISGLKERCDGSDTNVYWNKNHSAWSCKGGSQPCCCGSDYGGTNQCYYV